MMLQMGPMWVLAGLSGGWLAESLVTRGGYGLIVDMALGLVGSIAVGFLVLALTIAPIGMAAMFAVGLAAASGVIAVQRVCWRNAP